MTAFVSANVLAARPASRHSSLSTVCPVLSTPRLSRSSFSPGHVLLSRPTPAPLSAQWQMTLDDTATSPSSSSSTVPTDDARRDYLRHFICSGPVFRRAELVMRSDEDEVCTTDSFTTCLDDWIEMAHLLEDALKSESNDVRVYQYYLPIYFWILRELDRHHDRIAATPGEVSRPFVLGFSCPQGGGKTTMTTFMATLLRAMGKNVQIASLDDFYVTNADQRALAEKHNSNRLMQFRGMPGTHDLDLLNSTLDLIRQGKPVDIPKYDKAAFSGRGDRAPRDSWKAIETSTDVFLLEGWCLGFEPVAKENLHDDDLHLINEALHDFTSIYSRLDGLFLIEISNMDWVYDWRLQAEHAMKAAGKNCMTDEQVVDFVDRFMPAYKEYSPQLYKRPTPLIPYHELHIEIDEERRPVHQS